MHTLIDVGPSKLAYHRTGSGPDLVFVHGWPLHGGTFRNIVPHLSDRFTCHVFDLPGAGASEWSERTRFTMEAHADAIHRAIESLALKRVGFVAHDSGAAIARIVAARLGARCFGLAMGNTEIPGFHPRMLERLVRLGRMPGGAFLFRMAARSRTFMRSSQGFGTSFDDLRALEGDFGDLFVWPLADARVFAGQWGMVRDFDWKSVDEMEATHRRISAPVLLLWGKDDPWFPLCLLYTSRCV